MGIIHALQAIDDSQRLLHRRGSSGVLLSSSIHTSRRKHGTLLSGLMSWMRSGKVTSRNDLLTWAKTEYGNDWRYAYEFMLANNGRAPNNHELNGPRIYGKEVA